MVNWVQLNSDIYMVIVLIFFINALAGAILVVKVGTMCSSYGDEMNMMQQRPTIKEIIVTASVATGLIYFASYILVFMQSTFQPDLTSVSSSFQYAVFEVQEGFDEQRIIAMTSLNVSRLMGVIFLALSLYSFLAAGQQGPDSRGSVGKAVMQAIAGAAFIAPDRAIGVLATVLPMLRIFEEFFQSGYLVP